MPYEIETKDGIVVRGIPDNVAPDSPEIKMRVDKARGYSLDPTQGMTGTEKFLSGVGKAMTDVGRGVGQIAGVVPQRSIDESKARDAPLMKTGAGLAGNIAGNVATFAPTALIPGVNTLTGAGLLGGVMGGVQPVTTDESRGRNVALGAGFGVGGQAIANVVGRAIRPVQSALGPELGGLAGKAEAAGIPLSAAQKTGSRPLAITESVLENLPFTADRQLAIKEAQKQAFNAASLKTIGETSNKATPEVLNAARVRIGQQFQDLAARNVVGLDDEFVNALARIDASRTIFSSPKINDTVEKALELAASGKISGREYQTIRSSLGKLSKSAFTSDAELGQALEAVRSALDDAAERSISKADKQAWGEARRQWQALKVIEKAAAPTSADAVAGNVSPAKLAQALNVVDKKGFTYGTGQQDLGDIARIGQAFVKESIPNSGTAQRSFYQNMIENPLRIIPAAAGMGSVPLQAMLNSPGAQRYLTQGLLPQNRAIGLLGAAGERGLAMGLPAGLLANER